MRAPPLHPSDRTTVSRMQHERLRMRVELMELITGAKQTIAQSQALLIEADVILAKGKLPLPKSILGRR
jgi:hypothetical protein